MARCPNAQRLAEGYEEYADRRTEGCRSSPDDQRSDREIDADQADQPQHSIVGRLRHPATQKRQ